MLEKKMEYILTEHRWIFVVFFLMPCTFLFDIFITCSRIIDYILHFTENREKLHHVKVADIQKQINIRNKWFPSKPMCSARPGWKSMTFRNLNYKDNCFRVSIDLSEIIDINFVEKTVTVEPLVTMIQLSTFLNRKGWTVPVIIEMNDVTVGGVIMGMGFESNSHKHGLFHNSCLSYELILHDGSLVTCSKDENSDLFYCVPGSHGTIGFVASIKIKIIPAPRYVKLTYDPVYSLDEAVRKFEDNLDNEFLEAIMYSMNEGVIISGVGVQDVDEESVENVAGRWYKPWFFKHVETFLKRGIGKECIPYIDYCHRHNKPMFWELQDIVPFGNNLWFRILFGWLMPPKVSFLKLTQTQTIRNLYDKYHFLQDLILPLSSLMESFLHFHKTVEVYPVWLCAIKLEDSQGFYKTGEEKMFVDIGLYGLPKAKHYHHIESTINLEKHVLHKNGFQMLHAGTHLSEEDFRKMYNHELYDRMRKELNCEKSFLSLYDKSNKWLDF